MKTRASEEDKRTDRREARGPIPRRDFVQVYRIQTALKPALQQKSVRALNEQLNEDLQGATVTIDNKTRRLLPYPEGRNYQKYNFNHAFQAFRQPGSVIKPHSCIRSLYREIQGRPSMTK